MLLAVVRVVEVQYIQLPIPSAITGTTVRPILDNYIGPTDMCSRLIKVNALGQRARYPKEVWTSKLAMRLRCPRNRAVDTLCKDVAPGGARGWYGNIIVLKFAGTRLKEYRPVTMSDSSLLTMYFSGRLGV